MDTDTGLVRLDLGADLGSASGSKRPRGHIHLTFEAAEDGGTLLRLRHYGKPAELRANVDEGWGYFLPRLAEALT